MEMYINAVQQVDGVIERVELRTELRVNIYGEVKTRLEIVTLLKSEIEIYTARRESSDSFYLKKGSQVVWYKKEDGLFIRTESNGVESDNLESLPSSFIFQIK